MDKQSQISNLENQKQDGSQNLKNSFKLDGYSVLVLYENNQVIIKSQNPEYTQQHIAQIDDEQTTTITESFFNSSKQLFDFLIQIEKNAADDDLKIVLEDLDGVLNICIFASCFIGSYKKNFRFNFPMQGKEVEPIKQLQHHFEEFKSQSATREANQEEKIVKLKNKVSNLEQKVENLTNSILNISKESQNFDEMKNQFDAILKDMNEKKGILQNKRYQQIVALNKKNELETIEVLDLSFNLTTPNVKTRGTFSKSFKRIQFSHGDKYCVAFGDMAIPSLEKSQFSVKLIKGQDMAVGIVSEECLDDDSCYASSVSHYCGHLQMFGCQKQKPLFFAKQGDTVTVRVDMVSGEIEFFVNNQSIYEGTIPFIMAKYYPFVEFDYKGQVVEFV